MAEQSVQDSRDLLPPPSAWICDDHILFDRPPTKGETLWYLLMYPCVVPFGSELLPSGRLPTAEMSSLPIINDGRERSGWYRPIDKADQPIYFAGAPGWFACEIF